ncbi:MAG: GlmU family protein [Salibacteraceae bacterium]
MPRVVLVDHEERDHLLPLTFTRPVADVRIGIFTIAEKWEKRFGCEVSYLTQDYLSDAFNTNHSDVNFWINGAVIPTRDFVEEVQNLSENQSLFQHDTWLATRSSNFTLDAIPKTEKHPLKSEVHRIDRNWKIFQLNDWAMREDFGWLKKNVEQSNEEYSGVTVVGNDILIEKGAMVRPSMINTETGPVYLAKNSEVMEGSMIRGGLALMDGACLKMGAKIYGATTIGPHSKIGGEVNNAVFFGYSNKGHDGFVGNSVVGEWCNLGADTNTSNLKNNYADVKIYNYALNRSESTGGQFCGLTMGDHAKSGINTMFNTGTVCGIFANVFGSDFPHRRIPDFGWGGAAGFKQFRIKDALDVAEKVMNRRDVRLTEEWIRIYTHLSETLSV